MNVSGTLAAWRTRRRAIDGCSIGFAPTMGALHRGTVRSWNDAAGKIKLSWSAFSLTHLSLTTQATSSDIRAPSIRICSTAELGC